MARRAKTLWIAFLKFSMPPLNLVKELNENPAGKSSWKIPSRYAWYKREVDIKA